MKHIALVGFMAAGKSTIGRAVARRLQLRLVDTDVEVERVHGPIPAIFAQEGEPGFRRYEHAAVERALSGEDPAIVAVGGGALTHEPTRALLQRRSVRVFLSASPQTILNRMRRERARVRPLLGANPTLDRVRELYDRRLPLYRESDVTVECDGRSVDEIAIAVCDALRQAGLE